MAKAKPTYTARSIAAKVLVSVIKQQHSLTAVLKEHLTLLPENQRSLCQQLCYGVLRFQPQLQTIADQLITKPLKNKDSDIAMLLLCGLYQLRFMRLAEHAALSETVNACTPLTKPWAKGLLNACLRNYQRQQAKFDDTVLQSETARYAHPHWLIEQLKNDWPTEWSDILHANNQQAPMMLRVNQLMCHRQEYLAQLKQAGIAASPLTENNVGICLKTACDVMLLPGFTAGTVSVQDGAAQLVADLLDIKPQQHILDACAAPGGKTGHILEIEPENSVIALDIDQKRLGQIQQNLDRLQLSATLKTADANDTQNWWNGEEFDRILIDAPCSGTGVIRRHPDIKLLRRPSDIPALVEKQQQLLESLWPLLKTGGVLVYTTCSTFKQENEQQMVNFIAQHNDAEEVTVPTMTANRRTVGYQRLPGESQMDGFYYACLRKI